MQRDSKTCKVIGHEMHKITHICTYKQCQQGSRFICEECIKKQIHIHEGHGKFIKLEEDFHIYLNTKVKAKVKQQKKEAQRIPQFIQDINQIIQQLQHVVEQQENYITHQKEIVKTYKIANKKLLTLSNKQMNCLINFEDYNLDYFQTQNDLQKIRTQLQDLCQESFAANYQTHNILKKGVMESPSISQNEQFLGFISDENFLLLNRLKSNQTIMNKIMPYRIYIAKFSLNSQFIFISDIMGYFRQISTKNNFKQISSLCVIDVCNDFIQIDSNEVVLCTVDIIVYDYTRRKKRLIIRDKTFISCLEYDKINNLIVAQYDNMRIKFYDKNNGKLVLMENMQEQIHQIQLINQSQILLTSNGQFLSFWNINYQYKQLNLIKQFHQNVLYFKSVYQDQRIIISNTNKLIIVDENLNMIYEISINGCDLDAYYKFEQLQAMNYILILNKIEGLVIMKNTNQL